jgi:hypothetical protein
MRGIEYRELEAHERRIAMLRLGGASLPAIAYLMETSEAEVRAILDRPRVANYMLKIQATYVNDLAPAVKDLSEAIEHEAARAFEIEKEVMERLFANEDSVRAQLGAAATAQDILDRAGKRAPTRSIQAQVHAVAPATLEHLARIIGDAQGEALRLEENGNVLDHVSTGTGGNNGS